MTDEEFTAAIRANPRDISMRLAYADWLDERDDPRGDWLRLHTRLRQCTTDGRLYRRLECQLEGLEEDAEDEGVKIDPKWLLTVRHPGWEGAEIRDWQEFYDSLVIKPDGRGKALPKPTVEQLDRFEAETGFRLPQSYRDYILVFGPGRLLADHGISAPGYAGEAWHDLQTKHEDRRAFYWDMFGGERPPAHWDRVRRGWYFCSVHTDCYFWDPEEVCDPSAHEYAIYRILYLGDLVRVADSFREFVEEILLDTLTCSWPEDELGTPLQFEPATREAEAVNVPITTFWLGARCLGTFAIPRSETDGASTASPRECKLIGPPVWSENKQMMLWTEVMESGEAEPIMWVIDTEEEKAEAQRFYYAVQAPQQATPVALEALLSKPGPWLIRWRFDYRKILFFTCLDEQILFGEGNGDAQIFSDNPADAVQVESDLALRLIPRLFAEYCKEGGNGSFFIEPVRLENALSYEQQ